jgi:membrane-bound serine protease (ClpP class)
LVWLLVGGWLSTAAGALAAAPPAPGATSDDLSRWRTSAPKEARWTPDGWFAPIERGTPAPTLPANVKNACVIPMQGPITQTLHDAVKRKALACKREGAQLVVLDMDTPGGRADVMTAISDLITDDLRDTYTVAYVNPEALSAGTVIALACDEIVMAPTGKLGDATPKMLGPEGMLPVPDRERAKIESYAKAVMRDLAKRNGHNRDLCEAMVTTESEVWLTRNGATGELRYLSIEKHPRYAHRGKPPLDEPWQYVRRIAGPQEVLVMTAEEAVDLGFAKHVIKDVEAVLDHYGAVAEIETAATARNELPVSKWHRMAPKGARKTEGGWFAPIQRGTPAPKLPARVEKAFVIPVRAPIDRNLYDAVKRKAMTCKSKGAELVVFDMDTPGGRSDVMTEISNLITEDLRDTYTIAYVNPEAMSAGAVISLSCDEIAMTPAGKIGDAMPIMLGPEGIIPIPEKERGKIESYAKAVIRSLAKRNGYNADLCEAMITITIEIWLIRNSETGELRYLNLEKHPGYKGSKDPKDMSPKLKPDLEQPWRYVRRVVAPNGLLTMTADEAVDLRFAKHVFPTIKELAAHYHVQGQPERLTDTWSERLVQFLTSAPVTAILVFVFILGFYVEVNTPGIGFPGLLAISALAILFGSRYLTGLAQWWEVALFAVGLLLLALEIFVIPGFGVAGILGILFCVVGLLAILIANAPDKLPIPSTDLDWTMFGNGLFAIGAGFVCALIGAAMLSRVLPKVPVASRLVLASAEHVEAAPVSEQSAFVRIKPGQTGTVETLCRPVGKAWFGEELLDVTCEGGFLRPGQKIRVVRFEGNRVVVEKV